MRLTYWITFVAKSDDYESSSKQMLEGLRAVFTHAESLKEITKAELTDAATEVEIMENEERDGLVARVLFDAEAESKVQLDKTKVTQLVRAQLPFPVNKVQKRVVPPEELESLEAVVA